MSRLRRGFSASTAHLTIRTSGLGTVMRRGVDGRETGPVDSGHARRVAADPGGPGGKAQGQPIKRVLRKHGYPPDKQEKATQTVLERTVLLAEEWAA